MTTQTRTYDTLELLLGMFYVAGNFISLFQVGVCLVAGDMQAATFWIIAAGYCRYSLEQLKGKSK